MEDRGQLISTVGYSAYAIIVTLGVAFLMLFAIWSLGFGMRFPGTMPFAATCLASVAAICQRAQGAQFEPGMAMKQLI